MYLEPRDGRVLRSIRFSEANASTQAILFMYPLHFGRFGGHWNIAASNSALQELYGGVAAELMKPPVNALRLSLHPQGLAPRIANLAEWRAHLLYRLRRQIEMTGDPVLQELMGEAAKWPDGQDVVKNKTIEHAVLVPLQIHTSLGLLSFLSTTTVFGTPVDVTLSELAIEMFFPADAVTAEAVRKAGA